MTPKTGCIARWPAKRADCAVMAAARPVTAAWSEAPEIGATIFGQLNVGALEIDNGGGREQYVAENPSMPSRVGIRWHVPFENASPLTIQFETGLGLTTLSVVSAAMRRYRVSSLSQTFQRVNAWLIGARWRF